MCEHLAGYLPSTDGFSPAREHQRTRLLPQYSTRDQKKLLFSVESDLLLSISECSEFLDHTHLELKKAHRRDESRVRAHAR